MEVDEGSIYELQSDKFFPSLGWVLDMSFVFGIVVAVMVAVCKKQFHKKYFL